MSKILKGTLVLAVLAVVTFLGFSYIKGSTVELDKEEVLILLAEHEETMEIKLLAKEVTVEEVETSINDYQELLGACDNKGTRQKGKKQFEDLTEEKVAELIALKTYYLNELVEKGEITEEEAALKSTKYSEMLTSRLNGTFVKGSGFQKRKNITEKAGKMLGKSNKNKQARRNHPGSCE
ncbi:MAG: hypothetical protein GX149_04015 [Acholeplasmataceae bacterium]|jgi:hypothetical protein|nr:hypothetical protein [Acholeplasmataceae bacterium]